MTGTHARGRQRLLIVSLGLVALLTGCLGFFGAQSYLKTQARLLEQGLQDRFRSEPVIVAARNLAFGELVDATAMSIRQMPVRFLPGGALAPDAAGQLLGKRLGRQLGKGDPILLDALQSRRVQQLSQALTPGLRAITFGVDEINSFAGLLSTGDLIDLYFAADARGGQTRLELLLESVPVIATGVRISEANPARTDSHSAAPEGFGTVTVQVSADDAAKIVLAQRSGQITAVLRNPNDQAATRLTVRDSRALLQRAKAIAGVSGQPPAFIPLIVGGNGGPVATQQRMQIGGSIP